MMAMVLTTTLSALIITSIGYIQGRHSAIQSIQQQLQLSSETMVEKISVLKATTTNEVFSQKLNYSLILNERKFHSLHLHPVQLIVTKTGETVAKRPSSSNQTLSQQVVRDILNKEARGFVYRSMDGCIFQFQRFAGSGLHHRHSGKGLSVAAFETASNKPGMVCCRCLDRMPGRMENHPSRHSSHCLAPTSHGTAWIRRLAVAH